jgi:hypothetical protein
VRFAHSRRPKIDWREPAALADAIARIGLVFGQNVKIASIIANDREARVTIEDPTHGSQPATFEFSADGVSRATISFPLEAMGPRFGVAELAALNEQKLAALEADALKTFGANRPAYLESVTIGAHQCAGPARMPACGIFRRIRHARTTLGSFTISTVAHWIRRNAIAQDFDCDGSAATPATKTRETEECRTYS